MKKAMRQVAGTAVLGVALAAAAITPAAAAADGLGDTLSGLPTGGLPTVSGLPTGSVHDLATGPVSDGRQALTSQTGSVHAVTGTAQDLVDTATPSLQSATQTVDPMVAPAAAPAAAPGADRALPQLPTNGLPVVGQVPAVSSLPGVGQASGATSDGLSTVTSSLPVQTPLG